MPKTADEIRAELTEPFDPDELEWRPQPTGSGGKGLALCYVTARAVQDRLDRVMGVDGWQDSYEYITATNCPGFLCTLSLLIDGKWVSRSDGASTTKVDPLKGGVSDALKRAAVKFGVGRYLYKLGQTWVDLDNNRIPRGWKPPQLPAWALPGGVPTGAQRTPSPSEAMEASDTQSGWMPEPEPAGDFDPSAPPDLSELDMSPRPTATGPSFGDEPMPKGGPFGSIWKKNSDWEYTEPPQWKWAGLGNVGGGRHEGLEWACGVMAKTIEEDPNGQYVKYNKRDLERGRKVLAYYKAMP